MFFKERFGDVAIHTVACAVHYNMWWIGFSENKWRIRNMLMHVLLYKEKTCNKKYNNKKYRLFIKGLFHNQSVSA